MSRSSQIEAEIVACEQQLYKAQRYSDVPLLQGLLADELVFVGPSGDIVTKQMDLELHRSGGMTVTQLEAQSSEIRCLQDAAVAVTKVFLAGTFQGAPFAGDFRYTRVWQRTAQGWQVVAGHCSAITSASL
jgi:ketosteroid isomerase-like protein